MTDNTDPSPDTASRGSVPAAGDASAEQHWICIERQYGPDVMVGPYPTRESAEDAFQDAFVIDGLCEEDCLDGYITTDEPTDAHEQVLVDPQDPLFFGRAGLPAATGQQPSSDGSTGTDPS